MPMEELIRGLQAGNDGELLIQRCIEAGIVEAIDIAVVDESMHSLILGDRCASSRPACACRSGRWKAREGLGKGGNEIRGRRTYGLPGQRTRRFYWDVYRERGT